jgi:hypothetical protein
MYITGWTNGASCNIPLPLNFNYDAILSIEIFIKNGANDWMPPSYDDPDNDDWYSYFIDTSENRIALRYLGTNVDNNYYVTTVKYLFLN